MATVKLGSFSIGLYMSNKNSGDDARISTISYNVPLAAINLYNDAADDAARAATLLGALVTAVLDLTLGTLAHVESGYLFAQDATLPPAISIQAFPFDRINTSFKAGLRNYNSSIPARTDDPAKLNLSSDGVTLDTGTGISAEVAAYVAAFNAVVLGINGSAGIVVSMKISE